MHGRRKFTRKPGGGADDGAGVEMRMTISGGPETRELLVTEVTPPETFKK